MNHTRIGLLLLLVIVLGVGSGIASTLMTRDALQEYVLQIIERTPVVSESPEVPVEIALPQGFMQSTAYVLDGVSSGVGVDLGQVIGHAAVLTNDGWLYVRPDRPIRRGATVLLGREQYEIEERVSDVRTGGVFLRIDAQQLPVQAFGAGFDLATSDLVMLSAPFGNVRLRRVLRQQFPTGVVTQTQDGWRRVELDPEVGNTSALVATEQGALVGVVDPVSADMIPIEVVRASLDTLLSGEPVREPVLGVTTISLAHTRGLSPSLTRELRTGALLYGRSAALPGSAAANAGLLVGDVILRVDDQVINEERTLAEALLGYRSGESVRMQIDRDGEEQDLIVVLQ